MIIHFICELFQSKIQLSFVPVFFSIFYLYFPFSDLSNTEKLLKEAICAMKLDLEAKNKQISQLEQQTENLKSNPSEELQNKVSHDIINNKRMRCYPKGWGNWSILSFKIIPLTHKEGSSKSLFIHVCCSSSPNIWVAPCIYNGNYKLILMKQ